MKKLQKDVIDYAIEEALNAIDTFLVSTDPRTRQQLRLVLRRLVRGCLKVVKS